MRNLNALSAYPVIVNPTHYVGDEGWFSDTEPPPERKKKEEAEELMEERTHQERVKEEALNRQIQVMRQKLKTTKTEL